MLYEHAFVGNLSVPSLLAAVRQDEVFIRIKVAHNLVSHIGFLTLGIPGGQGVGSAGLQRLQLHPSHEFFLIGRVAHRSHTVHTIGIAIVAAAAHQTPVAHAVVAGIISGIKVGQAQAVRELMAESADAIEHLASVAAAAHLVEHGKAVDGHTIARARACAVVPLRAAAQFPLAGPHRVADAALRLAHAGIDHDAHIGLAVAVVVVKRPVDVVAGLVDGFAHHAGHALVVAAGVAAIGGTGAGQRVDTVHVELRRVLAVTLVAEVLENAFCATGVLSFESLHRVAHLLVGVLNQNDGHARRPGDRHLHGAHLARGRRSTGASPRGCLDTRAGRGQRLERHLRRMGRNKRLLAGGTHGLVMGTHGAHS